MCEEAQIVLGFFFPFDSFMYLMFYQGNFELCWNVLVRRIKNHASFLDISFMWYHQKGLGVFLLLLLIWEVDLSSLFDLYFLQVSVDVLVELLKAKPAVLQVAMVKQEKIAFWNHFKLEGCCHVTNKSSLWIFFGNLQYLKEFTIQLVFFFCH